MSTQSGAGYQRTSYAGVTIQYSGYNGEQRDDALGQEYVYIEGTLTRTLSLRVLGYAAGSANVQYSWGYYAGATGTGSTLKSQLHNIIDGHTELPYSSSSFDCWDALRVSEAGALALWRGVCVGPESLILCACHFVAHGSRSR